MAVKHDEVKWQGAKLRDSRSPQTDRAKEEGFREEWPQSQELKDEGYVCRGPRRHIPGRGRPVELSAQRSWEKSSA